MRRVLPSRRPCITVNAEYNGMPLVVTIGVDPATGAAMEVFAHGPRYGADLTRILDDHCTIASNAMQYGAPPEALAKACGTVPVIEDGHEATAPASAIGVVMDAVNRLPEHVKWIEEQHAKWLKER
jgi:hypothetical protein